MIPLFTGHLCSRTNYMALVSFISIYLDIYTQHNTFMKQDMKTDHSVQSPKFYSLRK